MNDLNRRQMLQLGVASAVGAALPFGLSTSRLAANDADKLPVAGIVTEYRSSSHADVILGKILEGYQQDGGPGPGLRLVSLYTDQVPDADLSRRLADKHGFRIASTIDEAITLGTHKVQVAGVLSIGEHGQYPYTPDTKQHMYPRRRFFDEIVAAFKRGGKSVPVFNDKHLGYRWDDALFMVETSRKMGFPLLAGSSVPLAWRQPIVDLPMDCEVEAALTIGYSGFEVYGFHALEAHESMLERRRGGESGVAAVSTIQGPRLEQARATGAWSEELFAAALKAMPGEIKDDGKWLKEVTAGAYLLEHTDGLKSSVIMANGLASEFAFAAKLKGQRDPVAVWFHLQSGPPYGHFAYIVQAFEQMLRTGKAPYPIDRTLLTTGILDRIMHSLADDGQTFKTPELQLAYRAADWPFANRADSPLILPNG